MERMSEVLELIGFLKHISKKITFTNLVTYFLIFKALIYKMTRTPFTIDPDL